MLPLPAMTWIRRQFRQDRQVAADVGESVASRCDGVMDTVERCGAVCVIGMRADC